MSGDSRRTEIRIETHEIEIVRFQKRQASTLCSRCGEVVMALTHDQKADFLQTSQEEVFRLADARTVCGDSSGEDNEIVTQKALQTNF